MTLDKQERLRIAAEISRLVDAAQTHPDSAVRTACQDRALHLKEMLNKDRKGQEGR